MNARGEPVGNNLAYLCTHVSCIQAEARLAEQKKVIANQEAEVIQFPRCLSPFATPTYPAGEHIWFRLPVVRQIGSAQLSPEN
jgi:hypothetical protein